MASLGDLERVKEAKELMRNTMPVARRVLGKSHNITLTMHLNYALALYKDASATLDDLREAVATLEDTERIARRVFGGEHPLTSALGNELLRAQAALHAARETTPARGSS